MKITNVLMGACAAVLLLAGCMTEELVKQRAAEERIKLIGNSGFEIELLSAKTLINDEGLLTVDASTLLSRVRPRPNRLMERVQRRYGTALRWCLRHKAAPLIASVALQVPQSYTVESYVINSGSNISAMAHLKLSRQGEILEGVALGDGPIDASFLALEKVVNRHYELDDFQIRAVTEGREAMGETVVRLVSDGRLYAGRGISTDIVFSSIMAYVNALNKIAYEEGEA